MFELRSSYSVRFFLAFLLLTVSLIFLPDGAQAQRRIHRTFDPSDGLVQSQIHALHEDSQGYLWIGTLGGLSRWDGKEFVNFTTEDGLGSKYIRCLAEDEQGRILVGHYKGNITIVDGDSLSHIDHNQGLPNDSVHALMPLTGGRLLISTDVGLSYFDGTAVTPFDSTSGLDGLLVSGMVRRSDGTIVLSTWGQGLIIAGGDPLRLISQPEGLPDPRLTDLCLGAGDQVICSPSGSGVWELNGDKIQPLGDNPILAGLDVLSLFYTTDGTLYLGTENQGVHMWREGTLDVMGADSGLLGNVVKCFEEGSDGLIYIGTWGGLSIHGRDRLVVIDTGQGLTENVTTTIKVSTRDESLWFGFPNGQVQRYHEGEIETLAATTSGEAHIVKAILERGDEGLLVGSDYGVFRLDGQRLVPITLPDGEPVRSVNHFFPLADGSVLITAYNGIFRLTGTTVETLFLVESQSDYFIYDLITLADDHYLVATSHGLFLLDQGQWRPYSDRAELTDSYFLDIHQMANGTLLFGTSSAGLYIQQGDRFEHIDKEYGLSDNSILGIADDEAGCIYLATNKGVNILCPTDDQWQIRVLNHDDGLASDECIEQAIVRDASGHIVIGTIGGVSIFDPARDAGQALPPRLHLAGVSIYDDPVKLTEFATTPSFAHHQNYLKLEFRGIYPPAPQSVLYRYRLSGVDPHWVESSRQYIQYTSLPHGKYVFELSSGIPGGPWSTVQSWNFVIRPPFWRTWWFIGLAVAIVVGIIVLLATYRMRRMLAVERLRMRIAADLHDDIGAGLTEISILSEVIPPLLPADIDQAAGKHIERIGDTARNLVDSMSDIVWLISPARDSLFDLVSRLGAFCENMGHGSGIRFEIRNPEELREVHLGTETRQNIYLIFKEAINNTVKYSQADKAVLAVSRVGGRLTVELTDDGCGFDDKKPAVKGSGHGLKNMRERALNISGEFEIRSEPGQGTTVRLVCKER